jgi:glycosyltransferase involved in cell wall biosynthesis
MLGGLVQRTLWRIRRWVALVDELVPAARNARRSPPLPAHPPLVSVVIATYNWSSVLRYAVASALAQTYPAIEVLVIGDGCTDDSGEVVASFGDPRISWHNLPRNSGAPSAPNNMGMERARGEYVAYLGHDDLWLPDHLALLVAAMTREGAKIAGSRCEYIAPDGRYRALGKESPPSAIVHELQLGRDTGWRDYRSIGEPPDTDFIRRASDRGGGILTVPALTVFKFPSAWRRNSYVEKPFEQQRQYSRRIANESLFLYRETGRILVNRLVGTAKPLKMPTPPSPLPPGWHVTEYRKVRGLE